MTAALREQGNGFAVAASVGRVTIPREAASSAEALRLADARADLARRAADPKPRDASPTAALADALALTGDHALGAAELAEAVAKRMGLSALERAHVRLASQLSGLGKLALPDTLLGKAGELTAEERDYVRDHPVIAERILLRARGLEAVAALVRSSRERFDGSGHPDGLAGEDIPLGARIVAVCDAFDAMLSHRPWRPAMAHRGGAGRAAPRARAASSTPPSSTRSTRSSTSAAGCSPDQGRLSAASSTIRRCTSDSGGLSPRSSAAIGLGHRQPRAGQHRADQRRDVGAADAGVAAVGGHALEGSDVSS